MLADERFTDLEHVGRAGRREVEALGQVRVGILRAHVALYHHRLGCALFSDQQHCLQHMHKSFDATYFNTAFKDV